MEATLGKPESRKDLSEGMARGSQAAAGLDNQFTTQNYLLNRRPDFIVYLYNVSESSFEVSRPPVMQRFVIPGRSGLGLSAHSLQDLIKNGGNKERYILATSFPSPLVTPKPSTDSSEIGFDAIDTRRFAMDIVNPDNIGIDQDAILDPKDIKSKGNNLGAKGVFFSLNNPPTEPEVNAAVNRMEAGYRALLEEARAIEVSSPKDLSSILSPEHHAAAEYFGESFTWHGKKIKTEACENCGDRVKAGSAFHKTDEGGMCIRDWRRAVKAGVRTKAQAFEATEDPYFAPQQPPTPAAPVAPVTPVIGPTGGSTQV
jgi:hypothetical protein